MHQRTLEEEGASEEKQLHFSCGTYLTHPGSTLAPYVQMSFFRCCLFPLVSQPPSQHIANPSVPRALRLSYKAPGHPHPLPQCPLY